ncbi:PAS domain S-box-containing protein [Elusimicrobium posterum]|uniref:response regulator n=1 Tax=Elusimicrobium posterum TaxID=3116653 RepID=UPI003C738607
MPANDKPKRHYSLNTLVGFYLTLFALFSSAAFTLIFLQYVDPQLTLAAKTLGLFLGMIFFFSTTVFLLIKYFFIRPVSMLEKNVAKAQPAVQPINANKLISKEFFNLASSINNTFDRLDKSDEVSAQTQSAIKSFEAILNSIDSFLYVSDPQTDEILFINDKMRKGFGLKENEGVGSICWKVLQKGFTERCSFCPNKQLTKDGIQSVEWEENNTVTGKHYKNIDSLISWPDGRLVHLQNSVDITNIKNEETALKQRLEQQNFIIDVSRNFLTKEETAAQITAALALIGKFMDVGNVNLYKCNREAQTMTHLNKWLGPNATKVLEQDSTFSFKEGDVMFDAFVTRQETGLYEEETMKDPEGYKHEIEDLGLRAFMVFPLIIAGEVWGTLALDSIFPRQWTDADKYIGKFLAGILSGVLARQEIEKTLLGMSQIADRTSQYVAIFDKDGMFTYYNPATKDITGYNDEELKKRGASMLYDAESEIHWKMDFIPNILKKGEYNFEVPLYTKNGEKKIMSFVAFTIGKGSEQKMGSIATDVTKDRALQEELKKAKETAEQASMAKGEFLSRMSHEIRTPINAIMGMSSIAKASKDVSKKDYCLEKIDIASTHLLGIINDILDVSKIEANKFEISNEEFSVEKMLFDVTNVVNFRMDEKKQNFMLRIDNSVPQTIASDEMRLKQVIVNLLTNASKFTPDEGHIELNVKKLSQEDNTALLQFTVKDSGIGLTPDQQSKLFRSFEQADGSISRRFGGTGLGLVISKRIVELMGGDIRVHSEFAKGSEFIFTIKAVVGKKENTTKLNEDINLKNLRVLAVDDAEEIRDYFSNIMELFSIKCDVAASGEEALALMERNKENPYNIIFTDWMMPGMDGLALTRRIRENKDQKPVVIMISMAAWGEIEQEAAQAGVSTFVPKPLFPSSLINAINKCLSGIVSESKKDAAALADKIPDFTGMKILIAEDVDINREIIESLLEESKIKIDFAENGLVAVEKFKQHPTAYNAILMDIQMPEMDGFAATREIRALDVENAKTIPIIAMTANVFVEDIEKCLAAGMNDHLGKPIEIEVMFQKLNYYLKEYSLSK